MINVNEVMTTSVKTCTANASLEDVARMMWDANCGAIPIVSEDNKPVGIVTDRDIAMSAMLNHQPLWSIPASTVIQGQQLCSCTQQEPVERCVARMEQNGVRRIVVTDDSGVLCGIVSMGDALAFTKSGKDSTSKNAISAEHVLGMLRKVSSHHPSGNHPLMQI